MARVAYFYFHPKGFDLTFWLKQQKLQPVWNKESIFITYLNFGQEFHYEEIQRE